jgi:Gram-negative bacterial TonB protein C-terminal
MSMRVPCILINVACACLVFSICSLQAQIEPDTNLSIVKRVVSLEYPHIARLAALEGKVRLKAEISKTGAVSQVGVLSGHPLLSGDASRDLAQWLFSRCSGTSKGCSVEVTFSFVLTPELCESEYCPAEFIVDLPDKVTVTAKKIRGSVN